MQMRNIKFRLSILTLLVGAFLASILHADPMLDHYAISTAKNIYGQAQISDVTRIPQNSSALQAKFPNAGIDSFKDYYTAYFKAWNQKPEYDLTEIQDVFVKRKPYYLENYARVTEEFYQEFEHNANLKATGTLNQKAIVVHNTMLRRLPTISILFEDPNAAGEGFPFDYLQQDNLKVGEPLAISHFSQDGKFAFVLSATGSPGFVSVTDIAPVTDKFAHDFQNNLIMITKATPGHLETDPLPAELYELQTATVLPLASRGTVLYPIKNAKGQVELVKMRLTTNDYIAQPLQFSEQNVKRVVDQLVNQPYGWGGITQHMDCASLVRDYFALFGTHLPLLTKQQKFSGKIVDISNLTPEQKKQKIVQEAIPYQSFIYFPGHIALYLGTYNSEPIILHAKWGIKLYDQNHLEYRYVIGKSVITTFTPGKELLGFDPDKSDLLVKVASFSNFNN